MDERGVEIAEAARDTPGQQLRRRAVRPAGETGFDMRARRLKLAGGEQHRGEQMAEHRFARFSRESLFAKPPRFVAAPRVERGCRLPDNVFGGRCHARFVNPAARP